ncbi:MAG: DNA polymerase III subunit gamma/tau [Clostridia bacterium]|nr:DNA polymerase III subunit gamma/tau [Clostridia bacterium]
MNLALYREFRPKNFDEMIGQDFIVKTLKNQLKTDKLTHAYLFCGPRGTGKTSTAKIFAKAVNCTHSQDGNPCGMCAECVALSEANTDIVEIDAASNNRVEEIRDLREKVQYSPLIGKYKVYIIDEVHMLTESAFNALLKTLEEPPKHVIFILATTEIHKLPATILSRCTRFDFKLLPINTLVEHLRNVFNKKGITCDEKSLQLIAKAGEGSVRDMLSIADSVASFCDYNITVQATEEVIGLSSKDNIKNILLSITKNDVQGLFVNVKSTLEKGKNIQVLCKEMADFIKNLIMIKVGVGDYSILDILPGEFASYSEIANMFEIGYLKTAFSKFAQIELDLKYSLNPENLFETACLTLMQVGNAQPVEIQPMKQVVQQVQSEKPILQNVQPVSTPAPNMEKEQAEIEKVWGNVLIKVKENNMFALANALINVNKVQQVGKKLLVSTNDLGSYEMIDNPDRISVLLKLVNLFDDGIEDIIVAYDKSNASKQDIKDGLKDVFKSKIRFKE